MLERYLFNPIETSKPNPLSSTINFFLIFLATISLKVKIWVRAL